MSVKQREFMNSLDALAAIATIWSYREGLSWDEVSLRLQTKEGLELAQAEMVINQAQWMLGRIGMASAA